MPNIFQAITFTFEGRAEWLVGLETNPTYNPPASQLQNEKAQSDVIQELNQKSDSIAQQIERELRKILPPQFSVQAEVSFSEGSIVMTGTVVLLTWLSSVATATVREEFESQFKEVIRVAVKRVISRVSQDFPKVLGAMEVDPVRTAPYFETIAHPLESSKPLESSETLKTTQGSPEIKKPTQVDTLLQWLQIGAVLLVTNLLVTLSLLFGRLIPTVPGTASISQPSPPATSNATPAAGVTPTPTR